MSSNHFYTNHGLSKPCPLEGHTSIMSGYFCLTTPTLRPFPQSSFYRAHPSDRHAGSSIPAGFGADSSAWQAQASSPLFQLPFEILVMIVESIGLLDLGRLALAGKACAQLVRWSQFWTTIVSRVGDGRGNVTVLQQLYKEALLHQQSQAVLQLDRQSNGLQTGAFPLGPCVRRLVMRSNGSSLLLSGPEHQLNLRATDIYSRHLWVLAFVLKHALPNLRAIRFEDAVPMPRGLWEVIARSSVIELDLHNCYVGNPVVPPLPPDVDHWPLTRLSIGDTGTRGLTSMPRGGLMLRLVEDENELIEKLLKLCAQSVEFMRLLCCSKSLVHQHQPFEMQSFVNVPFPRLKELELDFFCHNIDFYRSLLRPNQRLEALCLAVSCVIPALDTLWPGQSLQYPKLRHLSALLNDASTFWEISAPGFPTSCPIQVVLPLLHQNTHLTSLTLEMDSRSRCLLSTTVIPLLSTQFRNLSSLSLTLMYHTMQSDTTLLPLLSTLTTLQQLRLRTFSYNRQASWWPIDHKLLRQHLTDLVHLRRFAVSGDTYPCQLTQSHVCSTHGYFENYILEAQGAAPYDERQDDTPLSLHWWCGQRLPRFDVHPNPTWPHLLQSRAAFRPPSAGRRRRGHQTPEPNVDIPQWRSEHAQRMVRYARNYFEQWPQMEWSTLAAYSSLVRQSLAA
jgi:hypothetical protein